MRCLNCGNELNDGDAFCGNCGCPVAGGMPPAENTVLSQPEASVPPKSAPKSKKPVAIVVAALAVVVIAAVVAVLLTVGGRRNETGNGSTTGSGDTASSASSQPTTEGQGQTVVNYVNADAASEQQQESLRQESSAAQSAAADASPNGRLLKSFNQDELPSEILHAHSYYEYTPKIVRADAGVNLRSGPGEDYGKINTVARKSLVYAVADSDDGEWSLIYYRYYNQYGWMADKYLEDVAIASVDESDLDNGRVTVNGESFNVGAVNELSCTVTEKVGLVLRDNVEDGEWLLRMEDGDEITEICRSSTNPEWGYIEYSDGIRTYKGFAHSDYYSVS